MSSGHLLCADRNRVKSANEFAHLSAPAGSNTLLSIQNDWFERIILSDIVG